MEVKKKVLHFFTDIDILLIEFCERWRRKINEKK